MLSAHNITVKFGGLTALDDVSITAPRGSITGLVGPNGAGKTTLFGVMSGLQKPQAGEVRLDGQDVTAASPQTRARLGLARTFQQPELFFGLSVREHLVLAYRARHAPSRILNDMFTLGALRKAKDEDRHIDGLLDSLTLGDVADQLVGSLPLGTSRLVEVGRALATAPTVLLLDEPFAGLDANEMVQLADALRRTVEAAGTAMLLVEHDVAMVLSLCSDIFVLDFGKLIASGSPEKIRSSARVRNAYLGDGDIAVGRRTTDGSSAERAPAADEPTVMPRDHHVSSHLVLESLRVRYGPSQALFGVSMAVGKGAVLAVLGVNGAGKSTLGRAVSGLVKVESGTVHLNDVDITGAAPHRIRRAGLAYIPEGRAILPGLSVVENLRMSALPLHRSADRQDAIDRSLEMFPVLGKRLQQRAGSLSGGEQQMLALARTLSVSPQVIIADEMSMGLAPKMVNIVFDSLERVRSAGITIVLIEQFIHRALAFSDDCVILSRGVVGWAGPARAAGDEVLDRYLGDDGAKATQLQERIDSVG